MVISYLQRICRRNTEVFLSMFSFSRLLLTSLIWHSSLFKPSRKLSNHHYQIIKIIKEKENAFPIVFKFSVQLYPSHEVDFTQYTI